jgi:hypothetical protein
MVRGIEMCSVSGWIKLGGASLSVSCEWGVDARLAMDDSGVGDTSTYTGLTWASECYC